MWSELESAGEINSRVDRLLCAADAYGRFPTPVEDIVRAAELTEADDYILDESLIKKAPVYLRTLLRSAKQKIQGLVDRRARVVHVSPEIENEGKKRFVRLHETVHHILPHQQDLLYADDHETLLRTTNRLFEREANQGAAELLFQREHFARDAADMEISTATISYLANHYGSSFHAAFHRYAEAHPGLVAAIVLERTPRSSSPPTWRREEFMSTKKWNERFGQPSWPTMMRSDKYPFLAALDFSGVDQTDIRNLAGGVDAVKVDILQTPYKNFVLLWFPQRRLRRPLQVRVA
jgi:Zn-dependent peptidase ImmA (M78 family)